MSQQVRQLEDRLGVRLLARTTRSVAPTEEGRAYFRHACDVLQQVEEMEAGLRRGTAVAEGHLRVNVPVAMGRLVFAPEIGDFLERHPRVSIELGCTDRSVDLVHEGVDCALRGGHLPDSRLSARRVGDLRFALCAAPCYIDRHGLPDAPEDLARHRQIGYLLASTGPTRRRRNATATRRARARPAGSSSARSRRARRASGVARRAVRLGCSPPTPPARSREVRGQYRRSM